MRISTGWSQQLGVNAMLEQQSKMSRTQMQLSSGMKNLTPADDPIASVRALDLQERIDRTTQYQDNIAMARTRLNIEEVALGDAEKIIFRAKELTIQALNAPLNIQDRLAVKVEVDQLLDSMKTIANTKNGNGEFIFSGDLSNQPPFKFDDSVQSFVYQGGVNSRVLQIGPERQVADGDLGYSVFEKIQSESVLAGTQGGVQSIFTTLQSLSQALTNTFTTPSGTLSGERFLKYGAEFSTAADFKMAVGVPPGPATSIPVAAGNYSSLGDLVTAVNTGINSTALNGQVIARTNGNNIEFVATQTGSSSAITISDDSNNFLTVTGFTDPQTGKGADQVSSIVGASSLLAGRDYSSAPASFKLTADADATRTVEINLTTNLSSLTDMVTEINTQIQSAGKDGFIEARAKGNSIEFVSLNSTAESQIQINALQGGFLLDAGLPDKHAGHLYDTSLNHTLTDLDSALESFLDTRTRVGARLRALDDQESRNETYVFDMKTTLSDTQDLDYAEAISRFNLQEMSLQAAQQAFSRVQNLSLFNFLR